MCIAFIFIHAIKGCESTGAGRMQTQGLEHSIGTTVGKEGIDVGGTGTTPTEYGRNGSRRTECPVQGIGRIGTEWLCPILIPIFIYGSIWKSKRSKR
jgi:hypothetical protein